jgi:acyl-CoA reductase-like NAD-dependent aldehyde dehydrogenase
MTDSTRVVQHSIGGEWVDSAGGATFDDMDPFTGNVVARVAAGTRADAHRAVEAAADSFASWSKAPPVERQRVFLKAADILESRRDEVVSWLARETGSGFGFGMFQMSFVPGLLRQAAALPYAPVGQILPSDLPGAFAMGIRRPVGVVAAIAPWNAALILSARSISAPLAAGNTVVLKPSEESPYVGGAIWAEIFAEAGLPDGVLNVVTHEPGGAAAIAEEFVESPHVRRINFTGSTATGRKLAEAAGRNLKRVVLELGGFNPLIVLADADTQSAIDAAAFGAFLHQGQICMSARRVIVERPIADRFLDGLTKKTAGLPTGDPKNPGTVIGPLINAHALETVKRRVDDAVSRGARVLAGGQVADGCYQATLITDVPPDCELATVETFGPVLAVEVVDSSDAALERANATRYGLSAGIFTGDANRGMAMADGIDAGIVHINDQPVHDEPQMPFGGVKDSGWGRFGGAFALDEFTELRWITVQSEPRHFPF